MDVKKVISEMTLEEKAALCSGADFWHTKGVERLGVPRMMVADGPHGLRKQDQSADHLGINDSIRAVCFPTAAGLACSFDRDLLFRVGEALGKECQAEGVGVLLGPAANIKRSPLCGRNFEYFSEDPYLSGEMAAAHIRGVQSKKVGTSLKHYAANNQETRRMSVDARIDERTLREIYLASFEGAVKEGKPWTVMCSYNRVNGVYASESERLLTDILRGEWGFDGCTVTDWGACNDHVAGVAAGMDLQMPFSGAHGDEALARAVREGRIDEAVVDRAAERVLTTVNRYLEGRDRTAVFDRAGHHKLARAVARECMVLLKNDGDLLPLSASRRVAFIGPFVKHPRYQGGGSSHINASEETCAMEAASEYADVIYAQGCCGREDRPDPELLSRAVNAAQAAETAVLFVGLPDSFESEGYDRKHMRLPECQTRLIREVLRVQKRVVVVLHNGAPVEMPWADEVPAILEAYLGGQAVGGAVADLLFGKASPCGKLAETFPLHMEDNPSHLNFPGHGDRVEYREGIYVGYRYYDKRGVKVLFPFGHGLSYTTFAYDNLRLDRERMKDTETLTASVEVTNTGRVAAKEIVQFYVAPAHEGISRPVKELRGFAKVYLEPGETKTLSVQLPPRAFAYYETAIADWYVEPGAYDVLAAASSADVRQSARVQIESTRRLPVCVHENTTFGDAMKIPGAEEILRPLAETLSMVMGGGNSQALGESTRQMMDAMLRDMPLRALVAFAGDSVGDHLLHDVVQALREAEARAQA